LDAKRSKAKEENLTSIKKGDQLISAQLLDLAKKDMRGLSQDEIKKHQIKIQRINSRIRKKFY